MGFCGKNMSELECFMKLKSTFAPLKHGNMETKLIQSLASFISLQYGLPETDFFRGSHQ